MSVVSDPTGRPYALGVRGPTAATMTSPSIPPLNGEGRGCEERAGFYGTCEVGMVGAHGCAPLRVCGVQACGGEDERLAAWGRFLAPLGMTGGREE